MHWLTECKNALQWGYSQRNCAAANAAHFPITLSRILLASTMLLLAAASEKASAAQQYAGLYEAFSGETLSGSLGLNEFGTTAGGWATLGFTHNFEQPRDRDNSPVSFNYRDDEVHLHQLNLFLERNG